MILTKIRGYCHMLGFSQKEMDQALGCSAQSYYNKENGRVAFMDKERLIFKDYLSEKFLDKTIDEIFSIKKYEKVLFVCGEEKPSCMHYYQMKQVND